MTPEISTHHRKVTFPNVLTDVLYVAWQKIVGNSKGNRQSLGGGTPEQAWPGLRKATGVKRGGPPSGPAWPQPPAHWARLPPGHTFLRDGICSLSGSVLQVTHHAVHLGLMLQEEGPDDALVEQVCPVGRAGSHAPQQEATLQGGEAAELRGSGGRPHRLPPLSQTGRHHWLPHWHLRSFCRTWGALLLMEKTWQIMTSKESLPGLPWRLSW